MKSTRNNALIVLMLFMGAIWSYDVYLQQDNSNYWVESSAQNDSSFEVQDSDVEISEEDQIFQSSIFLSLPEIGVADYHLYVSPRLDLAFHSVWQPPKLI